MHPSLDSVHSDQNSVHSVAPSVHSAQSTTPASQDSVHSRSDPLHFLRDSMRSAAPRGILSASKPSDPRAMGLFDTIHCEYPLPDPRHLDLEAFFHARFFLEMAVRHAGLDAPPQALPSGYAALLYLFGLR
jgi:hypothetical protein